MIPNDNSPALMEALGRVQLEGASRDDPFARAAVEVFALNCACRATRNPIRVTNAELAEIGVRGTMADSIIYCGPVEGEQRYDYNTSWSAIDLHLSGIRIMSIEEARTQESRFTEGAERMIPRIWDRQGGIGLAPAVARIAILTVHQRDGLGREFPADYSLAETVDGTVWFFSGFRFNLPAGEGIPIPASVLPADVLAEAPRLVDDPRPNPPTTRPRPPGPALDSEFQRRGSLGKWLGAAGILVLGVGGLMAGRKILGGG